MPSNTLARTRRDAGWRGRITDARGVRPDRNVPYRNVPPTFRTTRAVQSRDPILGTPGGVS